MARLALADIVGIARLAGTRATVDDAPVDVLVVHREDASVAVGEQRHAVVVVAEGELLARAGAARGLIERDRVRPHGIAPPRDDVPAVLPRHRHGVEAVGGNRLEPEAPGRGAGRERRHAAGAHHERGSAERNAATKESAPRHRILGEGLEIGPCRARFVHFINFAERNGLCRNGACCFSHLILLEFLAIPALGLDPDGSGARAFPVPADEHGRELLRGRDGLAAILCPDDSSRVDLHGQARFPPGFPRDGTRQRRAAGARRTRVRQGRRACLVGLWRSRAGRFDQARSKCSSGKYFASRSSPAYACPSIPSAREMRALVCPTARLASRVMRCQVTVLMNFATLKPPV